MRNVSSFFPLCVERVVVFFKFFEFSLSSALLAGKLSSRTNSTHALEDPSSRESVQIVCFLGKCFLSFFGHKLHTEKNI